MLGDDLNTIQRNRLGIISRSGDALLTILNDVLDMTRIESGTVALTSAPFDLGALMRDIHASLAPLAFQKSLAFTIDVALDAEGQRLGDASRLRQVVNNLLSNAIKFTERGAIALSVRAEEIGGIEQVMVIVVDTGIGIAPDHHARVFERFAQVDASNTRRFGGTGLGLAISAEIVALMRGQMTLESEVGRGSSFSFNVPMGKAPQQIGAPYSAAPAAQVNSEPTRTRILAAEDNDTNRLVLGAIIDVFGFDCTFVENGEQAVFAWSDGLFDVVLMDVHMPRMDGLQATREIRARERAEGRMKTPIIALTASALEHQVNECLAAGMDIHVAKPIQIATLRAAIDSMLYDNKV
jgi:CheY-like chemotaxis protein/anti-sigma regulatory factor (Ser/Thr protein kinase)